MARDAGIETPERMLDEMAGDLLGVPGVVAVTLGGSRARGDHTPASDVDLGIYYSPPLDIRALAALARRWSGPDASVTEPGAEQVGPARPSARQPAWAGGHSPSQGTSDGPIRAAGDGQGR